jgi:hypothetical protein
MATTADADVLGAYINNQQPVSLDSMLGTGTLPAFVAAERALTVDQVEKRMHELEQQAPSYSFKDRDTVRNRYNRSSVPRTTKERTLKTAMALQLQEYDREKRVHTIDEQWLELRAHKYRISLADRRKRKRDEEDSCPICQHTLAEGAVTTLRCHHQLHTTCFTQLQNNASDRRCPSCRQCYHTACSECYVHGGHSSWCSAQDVPVPVEVGDEEIVGQSDMYEDEDYAPPSPESTGSAASVTRHMGNLRPAAIV